MDGMRSDWSIETEVEYLRRAQYRLEVAGIEPADIGLVLGSGLRDFADTLKSKLVIPFNEIHEFPKPRVAGHGGELVQGRVGGALVHCLSGRVHLYEGYHPWEVVRAVRTLALLGTNTFVLTNAAGGIREDLTPGTIMLIRDHLNLTAQNVLRGDHHGCLGPRFPPMSHVYSSRARTVIQKAAGKHPLLEGVYAQMSGPSYETPAEIHMVEVLGGDAVGMSTVPEAIALRAMGCTVAGVSLITNYAAGLTRSAPSHQEVVEEGKRAKAKLSRLLTRAIPGLAHLRARSSRRARRD